MINSGKTEESDVEKKADRLEFIREKIKDYIGGYRLSHTFSVEKECSYLAKLFWLDEQSTLKLRTAALLHDITKEKSLDEQIQLCEKFDIHYTEDDLLSPKIFHSHTGAYLARHDFPDCVDDYVFKAIYNHTTGCEKMNLYEKLLYLADYIEPERRFESCIELRKYFYGREKFENKFYHLNDTLILSFDITIKELIEEGSPVCVETVSARNYLICERNKRK